MKKTIEEFLASSNYSNFVKAGGIKYSVEKWESNVNKLFKWDLYLYDRTR